MIWEKIRSHQHLVEMFRRSIRRNRLGQAYLFVGPDGIGKKLFARSLAQCLFCERFADADVEACGECQSCKQMQAGTHPDYITVECPPEKSVIPIELFVGASDKRGREGLCHDLALSPMQGQRKIAVIDDANRMNQEGANAFLKTLEEPPAYVLLFMIANNLDGILPTIRSRCQAVRFSPLADGDVAALLVELELVEDPQEAQIVARLSDGSLETARSLIDPALRTLRERLFDGFAAGPYDSIGLTSALLEQLQELEGGKQAQRENSRWLLRFVIDFLNRALREVAGKAADDSLPQVGTFAQRLSRLSPDALEIIGDLIDRTLEAGQQIDQNVGVTPALETLFDDFGRILRSRTAPSSATSR